MNTNTLVPSTTLVSWQAPSHVDHVRSHRWYLTAGICTLTLIAYGIFTRAWSMSLALSLVAGMYFLVRHEKQPLRSISIQTDGVIWQKKFVSWTECTDFWIVQAPTYCELHIGRRGLQSDIIIQTGDKDPHALLELLSQYLTHRERQGEKLLDAILRFCKL